MSQHDFNVGNSDGASVRGDINNALEALASGSAGSSAPVDTRPYQFWVDTSGAPKLKIRNAADTGWITLPLSLSVSGETLGDLAVRGELSLNEANLYRFANNSADYWLLFDATRSQVRMFISHDTGNIGLAGCANPTSPLTVPGTIEATAGGFKFPDGSVQEAAANSVGKVLQVVHKTIDSVFVVSGGSWATTTGLSAAITPSSSTSKILVLVDLKHSPDLVWKIGRQDSVNGYEDIYQGAPGGNRVQIGGGYETSDDGGVIISDSGNHLDSPGVDVLVGYYIATNLAQGASLGAINRSLTDSDTAAFARTASSITLMEIAG